MKNIFILILIIITCSCDNFKAQPTPKYQSGQIVCLKIKHEHKGIITGSSYSGVKPKVWAYEVTYYNKEGERTNDWINEFELFDCEHSSLDLVE